MLQSRVQGGGGSIGIWDCLTYDGIGLCNLYQGKMDQFGYIDTLRNSLIATKELFWVDVSEWIFQQDNAPCHTAKSVKNWLKDSKIKVLNWPARSPDLNPIENIWSIIDRRLTNQNIENLEALKVAGKHEFENISPEICKNLFNSLKNRCRLCLKNKGGHIPY